METIKATILFAAILALPFTGVAQNGQSTAYGTSSVHPAVNASQAGPAYNEATSLVIKEYKAQSGKMVITAQRLTELQAMGKINNAADRQRYFVITDAAHALSEVSAELQRVQSK